MRLFARRDEHPYTASVILEGGAWVRIRAAKSGKRQHAALPHQIESLSGAKGVKVLDGSHRALWVRLGLT